MPPWSCDTAPLQGGTFIRMMRTMMTEVCTVFGVGLVALHFSSLPLGWKESLWEMSRR